MPSLITAGLHCLFLLVTVCSRTSQDSNFSPFIHYIIDSELGEEIFQTEMQRQKRNMLTFDLPALEYTVDIEISLTDSAFLEPIKEYYKKLHLPVSTNISKVEMTISNINITTVCLPGGENKSCCSCESGYAWPSTECSYLITCPSVSLAADLPCGYVKEMPFYGPYCEPQTEESCGMGEPTVMNMSVRLDKDFQDDLKNSSSELYKRYKADLEKAFSASYRCLPGFVSATVTGFRPGSIYVNYEVKAGAASVNQIASSNRLVPQFLNASYWLIRDTFTETKTNQTNFVVSPADISEGDTIRLTCDVNSTSEKVIWYHFDRIILNNSQYLIQRKASRRASESILQMNNITMKHSGPYTCTFRNRHNSLTRIYKATKTVKVSPLYITPNVKDINVTCNSPEMQTNSPVLSCCINRLLPSLTVDWKVNGAINITGVSSFSKYCTEYKLNISESLCPPEKSGTVTTYTCELQTGYGAKRSQNIRVTYLRTARVTISSSINSSISEGHAFNITCESDVSNYDSISWKIQSGNNTKTVNCDTCIENSKFPATSVLTVKTATKDWSGIYICTFSQKYLESSANVTVEVVALPLKQNILIDPIAASVQYEVPQTLACCISANTVEDYAVTFVVQQNQFQAERKRKGNLYCYTYNYTETECCENKERTAYCKFTNRIGQEVNSEIIRLHLITDKEVSCSDNFGIGKEENKLIKPCLQLNTPNGFTRGNKIYRCSGNSWKVERNNCLSVSINNLLTSAETLVNSPEAKANLPNYLAELKEQTGKEQNTINSSPANLGAIVTILDIVSSIPADAKELTIQ
ncbi:PREDICTED: probable G-protein coupled receptor 116, partial [Apaloderma vittatum]|uniref:probable G-protein coupled receptor 116 n=1 Tax=Apaloderma vittatum TaxID=57397 RepID=UPI0005219D0F